MVENDPAGLCIHLKTARHTKKLIHNDMSQIKNHSSNQDTCTVTRQVKICFIIAFCFSGVMIAVFAPEVEPKQIIGPVFEAVCSC